MNAKMDVCLMKYIFTGIYFNHRWEGKYLVFFIFMNSFNLVIKKFVGLNI